MHMLAVFDQGELERTLNGIMRVVLCTKRLALVHRGTQSLNLLSEIAVAQSFSRSIVHGSVIAMKRMFPLEEQRAVLWRTAMCVCISSWLCLLLPDRHRQAAVGPHRDADGGAA